jgi:hypothetical protein
MKDLDSPNDRDGRYNKEQEGKAQVGIGLILVVGSEVRQALSPIFIGSESYVCSVCTALPITRVYLTAPRATTGQHNSFTRLPSCSVMAMEHHGWVEYSQDRAPLP